mgnify:CR=1 FL=1|jgi:hypothetical protein
MESLAYLVLGLLLAQLGIGVITLLFSVLYRRLGKFAITSQVLIVLLGLEMIWGFTINNAFGIPAFIFTLTAALIRYLPKK